MSIAVAIAGASGRMGRELVHRLSLSPGDFRLCAAWVGPNSRWRGRDVGEAVGVGVRGIVFTPPGEVTGGCDVVIDFSVARACPMIAEAAVLRGAAWVCGTTGLDQSGETALKRAAEFVPVLHAANFSPAVAVMEELVERAARRLGPDFDVEILELHHRGKSDIPSGTALMLGRAAGDGNSGRIRVKPRDVGEVGYAALRGGRIPGEHTVFFLGDGERLELVHRVQDRGVFTLGALAAARALAGRAPGRYRIGEVLLAREN